MSNTTDPLETFPGDATPAEVTAALGELAGLASAPFDTWSRETSERATAVANWVATAAGWRVKELTGAA